MAGDEGRKPPWTFLRQSLLLEYLKALQDPVSFMLKVSRLSDVLKIRSAATYAKTITFRHLPPLSQQNIFKSSFQIACLNKIQRSFLLSSLFTFPLAVWHRQKAEGWAEHLGAHRPRGIISAQQSLLAHRLTRCVSSPPREKIPRSICLPSVSRNHTS